jgi:hypothetical protein
MAYGLCPVMPEQFENPHAPHQDHHPVNTIEMYMMSSSGGSVTITPPTGRLTLTGYAPTIKIG